MEKSIALMAGQLNVRFTDFCVQILLIFLQVKFIEVLDRYPCNEDLECKYVYTRSAKVQDGDRIAIFKTGWKSLRNYLLFEWAMHSTPAGLNSVIFCSKLYRVFPLIAYTSFRV